MTKVSKCPVHDTETSLPEFEISTDGVTVWVNGPEYLLGRFGRLGIDVHSATGGECQYCTHGDTSRFDWYVFCGAMAQFHQIDVPDTYMPVRFLPEPLADKPEKV